MAQVEMSSRTSVVVSDSVGSFTPEHPAPQVDDEPRLGSGAMIGSDSGGTGLDARPRPELGRAASRIKPEPQDSVLLSVPTPCAPAHEPKGTQAKERQNDCESCWATHPTHRRARKWLSRSRIGQVAHVVFLIA